ncbi:hypothetical protein HMPREF6745_1524 [Prevotella sp. oral taxon 472 str. F0295]|nr:hypothetical protein HMPREF6745_1524 [Prevotella sp. oral taxon 472 str. F0295]
MGQIRLPGPIITMMPKDGPTQAGLIYGIRLMSAKKAGGTNATWPA